MKNLASLCTLPLLAAASLMFAAGCGRDDVKVYKVDSNDTTVTPPPSAAAPSAMPAEIMASDNSGLPKLKYTLPGGWKEKPLTQLRVASFDVQENGKTADISVIPLSGTAGGDVANVNRWRGQVGQPPLEEAAVKQSAGAVEIAGQPSKLYDIAGTSPGSGEAERILGAIMHSDDTVWYFKMTGNADLVEKQKANFTTFLKSVAFDKLSAPSTMDMSQLPSSHPAIPGLNAGSPTETAADSANQPTWTVPADWKEGQPAQFLVAKFIIQGSGDATAAVNVSQLAGDGGGLLPNLNRWRAQLGQPPITEADAAKLPTIDASGAKAVVIDFSGTDPRSNQPARLVGVVSPRNGQAWFYKLMGDAAIVGAQKDAFIQFVQSAKYPPGQ